MLLLLHQAPLGAACTYDAGGYDAAGGAGGVGAGAGGLGAGAGVGMGVGMGVGGDLGLLSDLLLSLLAHELVTAYSWDPPNPPPTPPLTPLSTLKFAYIYTYDRTCSYIHTKLSAAAQAVTDTASMSWALSATLLPLLRLLPDSTNLKLKHYARLLWTAR
ncbi:hypothetical protein B484DRAFT_396624 [Ochromonadaceae sp. CCMP2298]|nr:hypothetical protein B484DRAFT_396624 [Ochromonadaceae sp. CCMP2298]